MKLVIEQILLELAEKKINSIGPMNQPVYQPMNYVSKGRDNYVRALPMTLFQC